MHIVSRHWSWKEPSYQFQTTLFLELWKRNETSYSLSKHTIDKMHVSSKRKKEEKKQQRKNICSLYQYLNKSFTRIMDLPKFCKRSKTFITCSVCKQALVINLQLHNFQNHRNFICYQRQFCYETTECSTFITSTCRMFFFCLTLKFVPYNVNSK